MENLGPIQFLVVGFETTTKFKGDIMAELNTLRRQGVIRVLDLLFVMKEKSGDLVSFQDTDLSPTEEAEIGKIISKLMGMTENGNHAPADMAQMGNQYGVTKQDIVEIGEGIKPGTAAGILLIEHVWAAGFKQAVREAGGYPIAQGFLTPDALMLIGQEVQAIAEAEATIEVAEAIKGAALLDALATVAETEAIKEAAIEDALETVAITDAIKDEAIDDAAETLAAAELLKTTIIADTVRTLVVAGLIEDTAVEQAVDALIYAGLLSTEAVQEAEDVVAQAERIVAEAFAQAETDDDDDSVTKQPESA